MINSPHSLLLIAVMAAVTAAIRYLPFLLFSHRTPAPILYLGKVLPYAGMAMLVIYALKDTSISGPSHGLPEILAVLAVFLLHKWKHNTLLSILAGTLLYMFLVQIVFTA